MSGFFCALDRSAAPVDRDVCQGRLDDIADVGPDGSWLVFPHPWLALGECERRETPGVPGPPGARQRDGCTLVADLRLDNRDQLLAELGRRDVALSDADLLLDAYLAWGPACVDRLVGEFSFALWDERARRLLGARDPMGDRALYQTTIGSTLVLSNEIRVPRSWPHASLEVDEAAVAAALVRRGLFMGDLERTFFRGVRQLPPGHRLLVTDEQARTEAYWSIHDLAADPLPPAPYAQRHEELRTHFTAAVTSRLRSERPLGSHLSGGLDSTSIACIAAAELARSGRALPCFSHVTRAPISDVSATRTVRDERFVRAAVRDHPNIEMHWAFGDGRALFADLEAQFHYTGLVHPNHYQVWWDEINAMGAELGLGTMLMGIAGNYTVSWGGQTSRATRHPGRAWLGRLRARLLAPIRAGAFSALRPEVARRLRLDERLVAIAKVDQRAAGIGRGMGGLLRSYSIGRFGIELRDPMGDRRIVEFCLRAPDDLFQRGGEQRLLIRDALRGVVPDVVLDRDSRQLQSADWIERTAAARPTLQRAVDSLAARELAADLIDWSFVRSRLERLPLVREDMRAMRAWNNEVLHPIAIGYFLAWVADGCPAPRAAASGSTAGQEGV